MASTSAPLAADPKHKGTLACVVLKAKNLPNKRSIGKQDPFAVLSIGTEKQKTKPDKRGGQHPTWDEQLHFEIYDDVEDVLTRQRREASSGTTGGGPDSSENSSPAGTVKAGSLSKASVASAAPLQQSKAAGGKKILKVACYADDNKEPEFIGEGLVDLTGVLKTGEFDEWVTIRHKDRYCGEVYLELTFFSSGPRPRRVKKTKPAADSAAGTYGGAGTFSSDIDDADFAPQAANKAYPSIPSSMRPGANGLHRPGMSTSASTSVLSGPYSRPGTAAPGGGPPLEEVPPSLRPSSSLAGIATYNPPYAPPTTHRASSPQPPPAGMTSSMTMPTMDARHRSESFSGSMPKPEMHSMYVGPPQPSSSSQHQTQHSNQPYVAGLGHSHSQSFASNMPSSFSTSSVASVGTIRPSSTQPPSSHSHYASNDPIQDLIRPMSSMSVQTAPAPSPAPSSRPMLPPTPSQMPVPSPYQHNSASAPPPAGHPGPSTPKPYDYQQPPPHAQSWDQSYNNPSSRVPSQSYGHATSSNFNAVNPTPPPHPNSAPPDAHHQYDSMRHSYYDAPPTAPYGQTGPPGAGEQDYSHPQQIHPAQMFVPSHGSAPTSAPQQQQPPQQAPPRPLSSSSYHALPPVPGSHPHTQYRAPSPSSAYHHHQQQPAQAQPPPSGSVVNAQSLYEPVHSQTYTDGYQGRSSSPVPPPPAAPMSSFSQSSQPSYYHNPPQQQHVVHHQQQHPSYPPAQAPTPSNPSRPLPPTTPQQQAPPAGLPPSSSGYYSPAPQSTGLPPSPGYQTLPYDQPHDGQYQGYGGQPQQPGSYHHLQQQHPQYHQTPPPGSSSTPIYQAPPPDQPRYIQSPYDAYAQQQQQPPHNHSPYGSQPPPPPGPGYYQ